MCNSSMQHKARQRYSDGAHLRNLVEVTSELCPFLHIGGNFVSRGVFKVLGRGFGQLEVNAAGAPSPSSLRRFHTKPDFFFVWLGLGLFKLPLIRCTVYSVQYTGFSI